MKKRTNILFIVVAIISFSLGIAIGSGIFTKDTYVGVYQTASWNGTPGYLALYDDGTCSYPPDTSATWKVDGDMISITITKGDNSFYLPDTIDRMTVSVDKDCTGDRKIEIKSLISNLQNVEGVFWDVLNNIYEVTLFNPESDKKTYNEISKIDGVTIIESSLYQEEQTITEHRAKIMENGLMLHGEFFQKVSD